MARVLKHTAVTAAMVYGRSSWPRVPLSIVAWAATLPPRETRVRARHAKRGCVEEEILLSKFLDRCEPYFAGDAG